MKPVIALDFDGTIAQYESWRGEEITGEPIEGAIDFIKALATKYDIAIFSARASTIRGKDAILAWLKQHGIHRLIKEVTNEKLYSFVAFVDDRAIPFNDSSDYETIARNLGVEL